LAQVGADLSAPLSSATLTVFPIVSRRSPGRLIPAKRRIRLLSAEAKASAPTEVYSRSPGRNSTGTGPSGNNPVGRRSERLKRFDRKNRWRHHDGLAGTDAGGGRRARPLWPIRSSQESPVPDDLALDFSAAADNQADQVDARFPHFTHGSRRVCGANASGKKKDNAFLSAGESPLLVLDDSGRDRRRHADPRPDDDCKRDRTRAYTLTKITRRGPDRFERVAHLVAAQPL
jgi:hypothetical protein